MGTTIWPLTAEEVEHRTLLARLFQDSTLAQLKTAAEGYRADLDEDHPDADPASAAQCLVELGRRGEWSENALATSGVRYLAEAVADSTDDHLALMLGTYPAAGFTTKAAALRVHLARAEQWLRANEARRARELATA